VPAVESSDAIDLDMFDSRSDAISEDDLPSAPPAPRRARLVDSASSEDFLGDSSDDDNRIAIAPLPAKAAADEIAARRRPSAPPAPAPAPAAASAPAAGEVSARRESIQQWLGLESVAGGGGAAAAPPAAASGARPAASPAVGAAGAPGDSDVSDRRTRPSSDDELPESFFASNVLAVQAEARPARARGLVETPEPEPLLPLPSPLPSPAVRPGGAPAARGAGPAGGPPSERTGGSRRLPKAGAKGASGRVPAAAKSGRRRRPDPAKLLESAIETFDETSASASTTTNVRLAASDLEQVESDLSEVESMIQAGAPSFSSLKGRRSSGERPPAFSADEYVKRKRRRGALARAVAGAVVVFVLLPFGAGVYFARGNSARMAEARDALARGDPEAAEAAAAEAGPFWVGERRLDALRREIAFRRALAPVERARDERRYEDALAALRSVRDAHRDMAAEVSAVEADLLLASHLDAGGKAESEGDLARAVSLYEHARRAAPARAEEPDRRIAAIRARLEREVADAEAGGDLERQVEAYRRMNAVFGGKEQALEAKVLAFDLQRLLAEGDAACERRDYERALGAYYKASEAARKLGRQDAASEVEEKTRAARRLGQFQSYFNKGQAAEAKGKLDDALQAYRSALTWIDKGDSGRAQLVQQRIEATEKRRAREGVDAEAARLWQEAVQALQQSRTDAAAAALEALRQVKPDDERVERAIAFAREVTDMVYVPAGEFRMGSALGTAGADRDEMPERRLALPAYFVDRFETRNRSYMAFIEATGERRPEQWTLDRGAGKPKGFPPEQADHPVVNVSWEEASRFAAWAKKRLPSEEEWEKAARGPDGRAYPWGDAADGARPNIDAKISSRISIQTRPGGTSAGDASPYGCADMGGNVSEWTASPYAPYPGAEAGGGDYDGEKRVIRGGSWRYGAAYARCANRDRSKPGERYAETGFRCVKDIPEWFAELR
jgi:formylglycine-generating enzyme required for sulfatase activity